MVESGGQLNLPGLNLPPVGPRVLLPSMESLGLIDPTDAEILKTTLGRVQRLDAYALAASKAMEEPGATSLSKALTAPPSAFSFATMSYMPDPQAGGLLSWPGIPPESIQRLARTTIAPEIIIGNRIADVLRYAGRSTHPWKSGWRIEMRQAHKTPSAADLREIRAAEAFIANCNVEYSATQARERDGAGYSDFRTFLATVVRDFLTYDAMAIWTDMDRLGRIKAWSPIPAGNVRLADPKIGYRGNRDWFAVLVDQGGAIKRPFTRENLIWHVGHPRSDPDIGNYPYCYSEDTEVLTTAGWKTFDKIDQDADKLASMNLDSGVFEWQSPECVTWEPYHGRMIRFHSRTLDLLVTPNHRMVLQSRQEIYSPSKFVRKSPYRIAIAEDLLGRRAGYDMIPAVSWWNGEEVPEMSFKGEGNNCKELTMSGDDYCALLGAYLAEGYVPKGVNRNNTYICQKEYSKGYAPYKELLARINGKEVYYNGDQFVLSGKGLAEHLATWGPSCYSKRIPDAIMNATTRQIRIFLDFMVKGDGNIKNFARKSRLAGNCTGKQITVTTTSKMMADQLQELAQKAGMSASVNLRPGGRRTRFVHNIPRKDGSIRHYDYESVVADSYLVSFRNSIAQSFNTDEEDYSGFIGCATVPNGILYVRRKGRPIWSGNSRIDYGMRIIQSFEDAFTLNSKVFTENSTPMGMLLLKGMGFSQNELDLITRQFQNLKKGVCFSADTEVLTRKGWKTFDQVDLRKDQMATLHAETREFQWQKPSARTWEDYDGPMYEFHSGKLRLMVTPNHRMIWARTRRDTKNCRQLKISTAAELAELITQREPNTLGIPVTSTWKGVPIAPKHYGPNYRRDTEVDMTGDDYAAFMGMYLAEGCIARNGFSVRDGSPITKICISQFKKSKGYYPFKTLLSSIRKAPIHGTEVELSFSCPELAKHLEDFGDSALNKSIPEEIMNATAEQINIFLDYYTLGDGHSDICEVKHWNTEKWRSVERRIIATSSRRMADQLQELAQKAGYSAAVYTRPAKEVKARGRIIHINESYCVVFHLSELRGLKVEKTTYSGKIGCVTVPNGIILVRRDGQLAWGGNSKSWGLPAMVVPDKSDVTFLELSAAGKERDMLYREHMNLVMGVFCLSYQFPWRRFGFHTSGAPRDSEQALAGKSYAPPTEEEDIGLITLLGHIETVLNEYVLWSRFPSLQLCFTGKSPREDSRQYEVTSLSRTWGERRAENDLPGLDTLVQDPDLKRIAQVLSLMPIDPSLTSPATNLITKMLGLDGQPGQRGKDAGPGKFHSSIDPAKVAEHGHTAGVRQHSTSAATRKAEDSDGL